MNSNEKSQNYGIDLLRIISVIMVLILHILGQGGILSNIKLFSDNYFVAWSIEIGVYGAIDIFALISGYLLVDSKYKFHKIIILWFQVIFYTILGTIIMDLFLPNIVNFKDYISAILPILSSQYWYFTDYFVLFCFIPYINFWIKKISKRNYQILLMIVFVLFSIVSTFIFTDVFNINFGYSPVWLLVMYLNGAYIKIYVSKNDINKKKCLVLFLSCVLVTLFSKVFIDFITNLFLDQSLGGNYLIRYNSPFIFITAICIFLSLIFIEIKSIKIMKLLKFFSQYSFGVYLIHTFQLFFDNIFSDKFSHFSYLPTVYLILSILGITLSIYIICILIDYFRSRLFTIIKINEVAYSIETKSKDFILKLFNKLNF